MKETETVTDEQKLLSSSTGNTIAVAVGSLGIRYELYQFDNGESSSSPISGRSLARRLTIEPPTAETTDLGIYQPKRQAISKIIEEIDEQPDQELAVEKDTAETANKDIAEITGTDIAETPRKDLVESPRAETNDQQQEQKPKADAKNPLVRSMAEKWNTFASHIPYWRKNMSENANIIKEKIAKIATPNSTGIFNPTFLTCLTVLIREGLLYPNISDRIYFLGAPSCFPAILHWEQRCLYYRFY